MSLSSNCLQTQEEVDSFAEEAVGHLDALYGVAAG